MNKKDKNKYTKIALLCAFFIFVDQIIKKIITTNKSIFYTENTGIIFGYFTNIYVIIFITLFGLFLIYYLIKNLFNNDIYSLIGLSLIISGALSNILDRIIYSGVIDYLKLPGVLSFWPMFNLADIFIVLGVCIYVYKIFRHI